VDLRYKNSLLEGRQNEMRNCNFMVENQHRDDHRSDLRSHFVKSTDVLHHGKTLMKVSGSQLRLLSSNAYGPAITEGQFLAFQAAKQGHTKNRAFQDLNAERFNSNFSQSVCPRGAEIHRIRLEIEQEKARRGWPNKMQRKAKRRQVLSFSCVQLSRY